MPLSVALAVIWILVLTVIATATFVYLDAPEFGMDTRKWTRRAVFMPLVGFFWYVLERREREPDPDYDDRSDHFVDGPFRVHKSRADDAPWVSSGDDADDTNEADDADDDNEQGSSARASE